jgi:hypothetical protein
VGVYDYAGESCSVFVFCALTIHIQRKGEKVVEPEVANKKEASDGIALAKNAYEGRYVDLQSGRCSLHSNSTPK